MVAMPRKCHEIEGKMCVLYIWASIAIQIEIVNIAEIGCQIIGPEFKLIMFFMVS